MKKKTLAAAFTLLVLAAIPTLAGAQGPRFEADLAGGQEVPPVVTDSAGHFEISFTEDLTRGAFEVRVSDGVQVTQSHLHCGVAGQNGPVFAFLFGLIPGGFDVDGDLAEFTLTDANILPAGSAATGCPAVVGLSITNLADLVAAIEAGKVYANVHTVAHPGGEIRGQLVED